jgi:hypothetical protein
MWPKLEHRLATSTVVFPVGNWNYKYCKSRVADPHWFNADPDTDLGSGVQIRIRNPDPESGSGSRVWWSKIGKKIYSWKLNFYFLDQKLQFTYPQDSIKDAQATGEAFSPQKRISRTSKHDNSGTFFYFSGSFLPSWIRIRNLNADPDPATQINADPQPCVKEWTT